MYAVWVMVGLKLTMACAHFIPCDIYPGGLACFRGARLEDQRRCGKKCEFYFIRPSVRLGGAPTTVLLLAHEMQSADKFSLDAADF